MSNCCAHGSRYLLATSPLAPPPPLAPCPMLLTPVNAATGGSLTTQPVTWAASEDADSYNVYLDAVFVANTTDLAYTFTGLTPVTLYTWMIRPVNASGEQAPCGSRTFTTAELGCPGVTVPTNGSDVGEVDSTTILWPAVANAATYNVYVWENGDPQPGTPTATTAALSYLATGLALGTTYRIAVDAVSADGHVSPGCSSTTFMTNAADAIIEWQSATFNGDLLAASVTLTAVRSGNTTTAASADYDFTAGSALIGPDFIATPGTVTFAPDEVTKDVVVPLVRDYDAEVNADNPWGYWKLDEASPVTTFQDDSVNNRDQGTGGGANYTYQQPTLNLSASLSLKVASGLSAPWIRREYNGSDMADDQPIAFELWGKLPVTAANQVLWQVGGSHGAGQLTKCTLYRGSDGVTRMYWQARDYGGGPARNVTLTFSTAIPQGDEIYVVAGQDTDNDRAFISVNGSAPEYVTYLVNTGSTNQEPYQLTGRITYISICSTVTPGLRNNPPGGPVSQVAFWDELTIPNRWARWNLDASLTFTSTLSNPGADTTIGAINVATMTMEAA